MKQTLPTVLNALVSKLTLFKNLSALLVMLLLFSGSVAKAQNVTVSYGTSTGLASSYTSLALAITALNIATINSPVTITLASGYNETAPAGGYSITKTGTSTNTITIQGFSTSVRNVITAPAQTSGNLNDAIFKLI